eukprot:scaffold31080_cov45-Attheya_sp.AAC.1
MEMRKQTMYCMCFLAVASCLDAGNTVVDAFSIRNASPLSSQSQNSNNKKECRGSHLLCNGNNTRSRKQSMHKDIQKGGESFALRMSLQEMNHDATTTSTDETPVKISMPQQQHPEKSREGVSSSPSFVSHASAAGGGGDDATDPSSKNARRLFLATMLSSTVAFGPANPMNPAGTKPASAYEKLFPESLEVEGGRDLATLRGERIAAEKSKAKKSMNDLSTEPLILRSTKDVIGTVVWAGALWLLSGSRSNPVVTPLANVVYDQEEQQWLKDRNEGLFAPLPIGFLAVLGMVFLAFGVVADRAILLLAEGDSGLSLELAGVSLIGGAALELGRVASGEKLQNRADNDRDELLAKEFAEFAASRIIPGGNCHRSEVTRAFRRYYAKYRQADNPDYPLVDIEIERLLRAWNRHMDNEDMSQAGFFTGIQINDQADVFTSRL